MAKFKVKAFQGLRSDEQAEEEGKWAEVAPGVEFLIRRIRSKAVQDARKKIYGPHERAMNGKDLPERLETTLTIQLLSSTIVRDWRGEAMVDDETGQPIPHSVENATELFSDPETGKDLRALALGFSNDGDFYAPEDAKDDAKN